MNIFSKDRDYLAFEETVEEDPMRILGYCWLAQQIGAGGVKQVIVVEFAGCCQRNRDGREDAAGSGKEIER